MLLILSVWLICEAGSLNFSGIRIPGLDGFPPFELHHGSVSHNEVDPKESTLYVSASRTIEKPSLGTSRNVVSGLGYLYLLSTLMGLISLKTIDGVWRPDGLSPSSCATRVLLIPFLLSMVSLGGGIFLWTFRNIRVQILAINENQVDRSTSLIIADSVRFTFLPCVIVWAVYLYFIYGCLLSFVFICRRSKHWYLQKNGTGTVNSSSWSFRDRNSFRGRSNDPLILRQGFFSRLTAANHSWRSNKSTESATLRSYVRRCDDLECQSGSCVSEEVNLSAGSEGTENNNSSRSFCGFTSSHRPLTTVHEECEISESSPSSSGTLTHSEPATRM